jgi:hypothetical protein
MPARSLDGVADAPDFIDREYDRQTLRALCPHQVHSFSRQCGRVLCRLLHKT